MVKAVDNRALRLLVGSLLVGACSPGNPDQALELRVGYIPIAECLPLYVAQEQGYFEREGLTVELQPLAGGAVILSSLVSGALDVGFSNVVSLVLQRAEGQDFFSVYGATYESPGHENHALIARSGFDPRSAEDWRRARIAVNTRNNIEELMVVRYLASLGVTPDAGTFQPVPFPQMLPALESGTLDVAAIVEPFISIAQAQDTTSVRRLTNQYLAISTETLVATYVSSRRGLEQKGTALRAFVRAMTAATAFIRENEPEARAILGKYTQIPPGLLPTIGLSEFRDGLPSDDLRATIAAMQESGLFPLPTVPDVESMVASLGGSDAER